MLLKEKIEWDGMQLKLYPFSYIDIQITLPYCLYIRGIKSCDAKIMGW